MNYIDVFFTLTHIHFMGVYFGFIARTSSDKKGMYYLNTTP